MGLIYLSFCVDLTFDWCVNTCIIVISDLLRFKNDLIIHVLSVETSRQDVVVERNSVRELLGKCQGILFPSKRGNPVNIHCTRLNPYFYVFCYSCILIVNEESWY